MPLEPFVHLRVHSEYSLIDGLIRINPLMDLVPKLGMNAIAITDHVNLFATIKFYQAAIASGIKPIIGCELLGYHADNPSEMFSLIFLCQSHQGYRNLTQLVSLAYQKGQKKGIACIDFAWISSLSVGLIVLSGGIQGDIGQAILAHDMPKARKRIENWSILFKDKFYLEIQRTQREFESQYNQAIVELANEYQLPLVATNDVCFFNEADHHAHEARVCICEGAVLANSKRKLKYSPKQYLRSTAEMNQLFHDLPQALINSSEIAKRCTVILDLGKNYLPDFPIPSGLSGETYLSNLAYQGLLDRLKKQDQSASYEDLQKAKILYEARLKQELDVINSMGFAGYFLIVADFIKWAKDHAIPVGPGRGSGAGSLVAYALHITDLNPLQYDLLFERFLNPERISMPDFDIDFCMEGRDRVIEYVALKYGRQSVSQIITFGTMAAKAVIRDVGRVLGHPYGFVDKLAKLIPFELGMTLTQALAQEPILKQLYDEEDEVKELFDLALKLEGITKNAGKHAGGLVIAPSVLTDFTAIYCEQDSEQILSQFDKDDVESVGLVKFDFLGLRTLTIIDWAIHYINQIHRHQGLPPLDIQSISLNDELSFSLLKSGKTTAVFQLESRGMKEIIQRLQPDCFEDIIALVALFRPGPLQSGMVDDFIERKQGRAVVEYFHPDIEQILKPTYGVIVYQEQVMQIAQVLANYTLGSADLLRRAMGKKKPEEMANQRAIFLEGAQSRKIDENIAIKIFDLMEKFAGYGFNKSHSAAYALISYQTLWLKANYPAAFMAAVISADMDNTDKVVIFIQECSSMHIQIIPPDINRADYRFSVLDKQSIIYGLGAIKGLGEGVIESMIQERDRGGAFLDFHDFCMRNDLRKVNRRVIEALIKSGSFDHWGLDRGILDSSIDTALHLGAQHHQMNQSKQINLFGTSILPSSEDLYKEKKCWSVKERLSGELETLGFYLSGHPADAYHQELGNLVQKNIQVGRASKNKMILCGVLKNFRQITTKRGKKLGIICLEDGSGSVDILAFEKRIDYKKIIELNAEIAVIEAECSKDDYSGGHKLIAAAVFSIEEARVRFAMRLSIHINHLAAPLLSPFKSILNKHPGQMVVRIEYTNHDAVASLNLGKRWCVHPSDALLEELIILFGDNNVHITY